MRHSGSGLTEENEVPGSALGEVELERKEARFPRVPQAERAFLSARRQRQGWVAGLLESGRPPALERGQGSKSQ